jgi:hypothetical protein
MLSAVSEKTKIDEGDSHARQHGMAECVTKEAHAAQGKKHTKRRAAERQSKSSDKGTAHEWEFNEGTTHHVIDQSDAHATNLVTQGAAASSQASAMAPACQR